jgi:E3 ubiquitin-protein ligase RNF213
MSYSLNR